MQEVNETLTIHIRLIQTLTVAFHIRKKIKFAFGNLDDIAPELLEEELLNVIKVITYHRQHSSAALL